MVTDSKQLAAAVSAAKEAVQDLDEPLKTEAFKILLEKLISGSGEEDEGKRTSGSAKGTRPKAKPAGIVSKRTSSTASTLRLGVEDLRKLKAYCARFDLNGTEQIAFVLTNFCREHTDLQYVTAADIGYLFRQLVSQKVKLKVKSSAGNDPADWERALMWLTAPSRKKEWLERSGDGYIVSNGGLLRFNETESQAKQKVGR